ncbi:MAG: c-type cytochrome [Saprospiraceae bacterium]|nr:c-type cytochrome [Saprospiraceae bacterium]
MGSLSAQDEAALTPDPEIGKTLFRNKCATCHNRDMKTDMTGPALGGFEERWADYPRQELYDWIRNSQAMISAGHPRAVELWNEWKPTVMNPNIDLTDNDIESLFAYIDQEFNKVPEQITGVPGAGPAETGTQNQFLYWVLLIILAAVAIVLARIIANLNQIASVQEGQEAPPRKTMREILTSRGVVSFVVFALVVFGGYTTVSNGIDFGRQQGYAPEQPIKFSHEVHSGIQGIDCQYCHDGARRSKHAVIPAANTCMNCHAAVKVGSTYGTAEITKIYASIGFDPNTDTYIENYETLPEDTIRAIYTKWIGDQYLNASGELTLGRRGEAVVEEQWEGIVDALTNELKPQIPGPIEWVRIHHLPDHVYFSHEQHVGIGKLECQACHGPVEEMEVLSQYAPLSMGWCINCHRETEVQFAGNPYYDSYARYHEELATGERITVTVEDIGGLECQKCHY